MIFDRYEKFECNYGKRTLGTKGYCLHEKPTNQDLSPKRNIPPARPKKANKGNVEND